MLPETGAFEFIFLAMVALVVVGPKDLPVLLRKLGQFTAKMRGLASEFRASFDEMARQSELDELRKEVEALRLNQLSAVHMDDPFHTPEPATHTALPAPAPVAEAPLPDAAEPEPLLPFGEAPTSEHPEPVAEKTA